MHGILNGKMNNSIAAQGPARLSFTSNGKCLSRIFSSDVGELLHLQKKEVNLTEDSTLGC